MRQRAFSLCRVFEDALFDDRVDMEEVEYWFGDNKEAAGKVIRLKTDMHFIGLILP